ncbi:MAG TPA: MDR family MFS transporter [Candidatus Limnocylindrales bacterium]|jgi:EmrB/QacA subfamily drug resistance transporter
MTAMTNETVHPAVEVSSRARLEIMGAIMLALFLGALDQTIVGPVLPKISTQLKGADFYTWVVSAYLVTSTAAIPVYGKLSDFFGRKPALIVGIVLFLIGSVLSGLSQTMWQLIFFRGLQGLGAGALFPISLAVIADLFTPAERGKYQGLFGAVFGVAFLVGPFLGGVLTDSLSWHYIFFVNVPIGLVSLYLIARLLPTHRKQGARFNLDIPGVITFTGAIVPVLIGLTLAENGNWGDPAVIGSFAIGLVFLVAFLFAESRAEEPMIPLDLFRNRTFAVSAVATFLAIFGFSTLIIFLPLWFQIVQGASTTASGYLLFPFLFGLIGSSIAAGQIVSRTGHYKWLIAGAMAMLAIGLAFFMNLRADTPTPVLWFWMVVAGIGVGPTMAILTLIVQNDVSFERLGTATSDLTLIRQIGTSVGLTISFTVFRNYLSWDLLRNSIIGAGAPQAAVPATAPAGFDLGSLTSVGNSPTSFFSSVPQQLVPAFTSGFHQAFSIAVADSMWIGVVAASLAFLTTLALKEKPLRAHLHAEQAARMGLRPQAVGASGGATPGPARPRIDEPAATSADDGLAREW